MMNEIRAMNKDYLNLKIDEYTKKFIEELIKSSYLIDSNNYEIRESLNQLQQLLNTEYIEEIVIEMNEIELNVSQENLSLYELMDIDKEKFQENELKKEILKQIYLLKLSIILIQIKMEFDFNDINKKNYDCFLSHCSWDAKEVLAIWLILNYDHKINAYVDWIDDKQANFPRALKKILDVFKGMNNVKILRITNNLEIYHSQMKKTSLKNNDKKITELLLTKINSSKSLIYIQSRHYDYSRWMPWELGIADANEKLIYRLPIKYIRKRKKYGKKSGFLKRYNSLIFSTNKINKTYLEKIQKNIL